MKERVTLTIDEDLLKNVDEMVDLTHVKNRSHAVELLLIKGLGNRKPRKAVILAGGKNVMFNSESVPRPMLQVKHKPLLEYNIELLKKYDIKEIYIAVGEGSPHIKKYFGSGIEFGVKITYLEETHPMGTAGSLNLAKPYLTEPFILCNGDELKNININDLYAFHNTNGGLATIALTTVEDPSNYGVALLNGHKITAFMEKPSKKNPFSTLINAGLYIIDPQVLQIVPEGFAMLEQDVFPKLAHEEKLMGYVFSGQWFDSDPARLKKAEKDWVDF
jgi:NDP-sugar pyrophosphorylase family protein